MSDAEIAEYLREIDAYFKGLHDLADLLGRPLEGDDVRRYHDEWRRDHGEGQDSAESHSAAVPEEAEG